MKNGIRILTINLALLSAMGCANSPRKVTDANKPQMSSEEKEDGYAVTNAAARDSKAHSFVEIEFAQGSALLSDRAKSSLNAVVEQARQEGRIDEVLVLSWSDEEYPSKSLAKLSKPQRDLAEKRNKSVEAYIKANRSLEVETHNMAERPNTLSKWFNTEDSKLKESFLAAGLPTTADDSQYPSKASRSVILIKVK